MRRILAVTCVLMLQSALLWAGDPAGSTRFDTELGAADAAWSSGQWPAAIEHYREALALRPHHAEARFRLAEAYRETHRYYEARRHFRMALMAQAADRAWEARCRLQIAACWEATKDYREALGEYRLALAADAASAEARSGERRTVALVHDAGAGSK
jgi:tetratricopeptide (TPR) repeat protein